MADDRGGTSRVIVEQRLDVLRVLLDFANSLISENYEDEIVRLIKKVIPSLGDFECEAILLDSKPDHHLHRQMKERLGQNVGSPAEPIELADEPWSWAFPLLSPSGRFGYLVISSRSRPDREAVSHVVLVAQQAGAAIARVNQRTSEQEKTDELRDAIRALEQNTVVHQRLTQQAVSGGGQIGIAEALLELTGLSTAIEDRHGNLVAWAGPGKPDPYPRSTDEIRSHVLRTALDAGAAVRDGGRLISVASPYANVMGVLALVDPDYRATNSDRRALEYGAMVLTLELTRQHNLVVDDVRLRSELVMELVSGRQGLGVPGKAQALGYDIGRPHRVVVLEFPEANMDWVAVAAAMRHVTGDTDLGSLFAIEQSRVILLAVRDLPWEDLQKAMERELRNAPCRVGVGRRCTSPEDLAHSYREAQHALRLQKRMDLGKQVTIFDELGVYQLLSDAADPVAVGEFVRQWLGRLIKHDANHGSQLVVTLGTYLDCGGRHDRTAEALFVHRNTLKYRLHRIREVSGLDLGSAEVAFNLQLATRALRTMQELRAE